ncbi:hypothetical protein Taro_045976 [Colocasia esculenta]|uniref:Saposin B-type domain-containing protein n=1 Tax=Colocasia esculenta TaxID=4460 RepID=A0A843WXW4_COLES|nr:hypothetical protein [Colocasia esculenta]
MDWALATDARRDHPFLNATCPFYKSEKAVGSEASSSNNLLQYVLCYLYSELSIEAEEYRSSFEEVSKTLSEFCQIAPSNDDLKYPRCLVCHVFVRQLRNALRNPFKQFLMIRLLRGACMVFARRWGVRECKRIVSEYAPIIFSTVRRSLKVVDLCHKMEICDGLCLTDA